MDKQFAELWRRVSAFPFDNPNAISQFSARLARENRWSRKFARRVLEEYRRFAFLSVAAGHPVSPSEDVDQAWHLHLIYTRSYWDEFCGKVLGRPLHHLPSQGGDAEQAKLSDWYARTLASYERLFGEKPPADIWPSSADRKRQQTRLIHVDAKRFWIIPKVSWRPSTAAMTVALFACVAILGCVPNLVSQAAGPLDWRGGDFLMLYGSLLIVGILLGITLHYWMRGSKEPLGDAPSLNPYEVAYLAGAKSRTINAVLARLVSRGHLQVSSEQELQVAEALPSSALPLERAVWEAVENDGSLKKLHQRVEDEAKLIAEPLKRQGLMLHSSEEWKARLVSALPMMLLLPLGIMKVVIGLQRNRPVVILVILCAATFFIAVTFIANRAFRSRRGDALLRRLQQKHAALKDPENAQRQASLARLEEQTDPNSGIGNPARVTAASLPLAVALFGPAVLADGPLERLRAVLNPSSSGGCSSGCSSGCGGGGCGGGGGGCGGCGGGGD